MNIIICEKPSQRQNILEAVGEKYGKVLALQGHVLQFKMPNEIEPDRKWGYHLNLPKGKKPSPEKLKVIQPIRKALKEADNVIIATDCDVEGILLGREVLDFYKYTGKAQRAIFTAEDPKSLQNAFQNLIPLSDTDNEYQSGIARETADYILGLSMTEAVTTKTAQLQSIGRVKTPTVGIVAEREIAIKNFKETTHYALKLNLKELSLFHFPDPIEPNKEKLEKMIGDFPNSVELIKEVTEKEELPPKPLDLASLCSQCNEFSIKEIEQITQNLYEKHKIITYPRSESRYIPKNMEMTSVELFSKLQTLFGDYDKEPTIRKGSKGVFHDTTESHFALIPNAKINVIDAYKNLNDNEKKVFDTIAKFFIASMLPSALSEITKYETTINNCLFTCQGKTYKKLGYLSFMPKSEEAILNDVAEGNYDIENIEITEHITKPPKRFTQQSLAMAMKNAWRFVEEEKYRKILKGTKGIGTQTTRGKMIETLLGQNIFEIKKKQIYMTEKGLEIYLAIKNIIPEIVNPDITARWELGLEMVREGKLTSNKFIEQVKTRTSEYLEIIKNSDIKEVTRTPSKKQIALAKKFAKQYEYAPPDYESHDAVKSFIEGIMTDIESGKLEKIYIPSEKHLKYAQNIADKNNIKIPAEAKINSKLLSKFIDDNK